MSYQALYRAFRPEFFSDVVGQAPITTTLVNQILTSRIAHAYLFCGSRGTGKTSTAKVFARAINCENPEAGGEPCGKCKSCEALSHENNMDVIEIDAASNNGVDEIRELRDKIKYPPASCRFKVYIIDEVHMLSSGAFNALLKTLEEPPSHAVFILCTTEPQKLPATILSRCQRYDFKRISASIIINRLKTVLKSIEREAEPAALEEIARASEGGMRDALSLMDMCLAYGAGLLTAQFVRDVLGTSDRSSLFRFAGALIEGDAGTALELIDKQISAGRDAQVFTRELAGHFRGLLIAQFTKHDLAELLELTNEDAERFREQATPVPSEKLMRIMELFMRAEGEMRWASQPRAILELCSVRACHPERELGYEALMERVAKLEQGGVAARSEASVSAEPVAPAELQSWPDAPKSEAMPTSPKPEKKPIEKESAQHPNPADEIWTNALALLKERHQALFAPAQQAIYQGIKDDVAQLTFPKKWNMYQGILQQDSKRSLLEQVFSEVVGRPIGISISTEDTSPKPVMPVRNTLEHVYDLFGRENVSVLDD